ncbi:putative LRR containing protein [Trachipleistophora hominis]|uniref:Putative LRR containing protein n=1 Tax=Trachipleistophora hominis TaxID=72359 RepID=L7JVB2_TRAHO|nr:putative LRR containing protein [Trachipleistophora hominis]
MCNTSIKSMELYVYASLNARFDSFEWIIPNDELCSQTDNKQDTEKQYYICNSIELLFLFYIKVISGFDSSYNFYFCHTVNEGSSVFNAKNIKVCKNISINSTQKISLTRVKIVSGQVLKINSAYNSLLLEYCTGQFIVSGIQTAVRKYIDLQNTNFIQFYRVEENIYSCKMSGINFSDELLVSHKIRTAQLVNSRLCRTVGLEFKYGCDILHLFNTKGIITSPNNRFKKILLYRYSLDFPIYYLTYHVYEIVISSCCSDFYFLVFIGSTKRIKLYCVELVRYSMVIINHECERIIVRNTTGYFVISNIIKTPSGYDATLYLQDGSIIFEKNLSKRRYSLLLDHVTIDKRTTIRQNLHVIKLISVVISERASLKINNDCEVLLIDSCNGNIDFSGCTDLRFLTIKNYKFIYHKNIYDKLLSLHLEGLNIDTIVRLGTNIKVVKLVDVTTGWFTSVQIKHNCETMYVRNFVGNLTIPYLFNCFSKIFTRKTTTIAHEMMPDRLGRIIFLNNVYLEEDYEVPNDVDSIILQNLKTNGRARLITNETCKCLYINVYQSCIDVSRMKNIRKVAFVSCLPVFEDNLWKFLDPRKCSIDTTDKKRVNLPNNIENVILERVNIPADHLLVVNEHCENVAIIFSEGDFDLSMVKKLKGIRLIVKKKGIINIQFPDLSNVRTLEVSLDGNEEYFNLLLSKCINAKKLIFYNTVCELHDWIQNERFIDYKEGMAPWELDKLESKIELESHVNPCRSACEFSNNCMIHSKPIFDYGRQTIITDLCIIAFFIDSEFLKLLKRFVMLRRLSIVTKTISATLFDSLPFNLNKFSLMLIPCYVIVDFSISADEDIDFKKRNAKNMNLVNLRLHGLVIINMDKFRSFPEKVNVLEIMPLVKINDVEMQVRRKMKVKKLIIMQMNDKQREIVCSNYELEEYFDHLLNALSQCIDFGSVEEIKIVDQGTEKLVDPHDYSTN